MTVKSHAYKTQLDNEERNGSQKLNGFSWDVGPRSSRSREGSSSSFRSLSIRPASLLSLPWSASPVFHIPGQAVLCIDPPCMCCSFPTVDSRALVSADTRTQTTPALWIVSLLSFLRSYMPLYQGKTRPTRLDLFRDKLDKYRSI